MKDETLILCNYKKGKIIFPERNEKYDGEYVFIVNRPDDFSLYKVDSFNEFQKRLFEARKKIDDKALNRKARYILARSEIVNIVNGVFEVPMYGLSQIYSEVFQTQISFDHMRFMSSDAKTIYEEQKILLK